MDNTDAKITYVHVSNYNTQSFVKLGFHEFKNTLDSMNIDRLFVYEGKNDRGRPLTQFLFYDNGLMYISNSKGYKTIDDIVEGYANGFDRCNSQITLIGGEATEQRYSEDDEWKPNDGTIFYYVKSLGYCNFPEYLHAFKSGFGNQTKKVYDEAAKLGFKEFHEYANYQKKLQLMNNAGFNNIEEYEKAQELGLQNKQAFNDYRILQEVKNKYAFATLQETHLFLIVNRITLKREKSISTLFEIIERENPSRKSYKTHEWYKKKFNGVADVEAFLSNNKQVAQVGTYYPEKRLFISFSDKTIFVDGSNVAYNNKDKQTGAIPLAKNIKLVINELKKHGFSDIKVIFDANLPYKIGDTEVLKELEAAGMATKSPSKTEADDFLIKYAKEYNAYIVTSDTYKKWAEKDSWVNKNIDHFRIGFMISDDIVKFSDSFEQIDNSTFKNLGKIEFHGFDSMQSRD